MNKLDVASHAKILSMLCEGASMRSVSRLADVSINTVAKILADAGKFCAGYHDATFRGVKAKRVQVDEVWSFVAAKDKNVPTMKVPVDGAGSVWTWTAVGADTKLIISHFVGGRDGECAAWFMQDVAERVAGRIQLTSDEHRAYLEAVEGAFGADVDFAMLNKIYGASPESAKGRYSPAECISAKKKRITGKPEMAHVFGVLCGALQPDDANAQSSLYPADERVLKEVREPSHMVAIWSVWYNFIRIHKTLRVTPATAAGVSQNIMDWKDFVALMDADAPKPRPRGPYKKAAKDESEAA